MSGEYSPAPGVLTWTSTNVPDGVLTAHVRVLVPPLGTAMGCAFIGTFTRLFEPVVVSTRVYTPDASKRWANVSPGASVPELNRPIPVPSVMAWDAPANWSTFQTM